MPLPSGYVAFCRRSREGAWIEIGSVNPSLSAACGRSREGAWIEIVNFLGRAAPFLSLP